MKSAPMRSSSPVVMPGRTAAAMWSRASPTRRPTRFRASRSDCERTVMRSFASCSRSAHGRQIKTMEVVQALLLFDAVAAAVVAARTQISLHDFADAAVLLLDLVAET